MKRFITMAFLVAATSLAAKNLNGTLRGANDMLWYRQPAKSWYEALPVGNGHMGAMVFGGIKTENIQLNEGTLWSGGPYTPAREGAFKAVMKARELVFKGGSEAQSEACGLLYQNAMGEPMKETAFLPLGNLKLDFLGIRGEVGPYRRSLDLERGIVETRFKANGIEYVREVFASYPDKVIVVHLSASTKGALKFRASFESPLPGFRQFSESGFLTMEGHGSDYHRTVKEWWVPDSIPKSAREHVSDVDVKGAIVARARLGVLVQGGTLKVSDSDAEVEGADSATLIISATTNFKNYHDVSGDPSATSYAYLKSAMDLGASTLESRHLSDYQALYKRVSLSLGPETAPTLATDERIKEFFKGKDPQLASLLFQFGRYLLISSSREGGQPANLQGIWNGQNFNTGELDMSGSDYYGSPMGPAWGSKYTMNINLEMNYWPAETANLDDCTGPLFGLIRDLSESGKDTAKKMYGAKGWVAHHNTDLWRGSAPVDFPPTGFWPMAGAWLCTHLWEHYLFTSDKEFLAKAYPVMKGASEFFVDFLVVHPGYPQQHWMVTCPSYSPENGPLCAGPTMDNALLRDLFGQTAKAAEILGQDEAFREKILSLRSQLPPFKVGKWGQFQEWLEDNDSPQDQNRHVSQLYALYPSDQVTQARTPELFNAAKVSLIARGDAGTGWSLGWKINMWARLLDGDHAYKILSNLLSAPGSHGKTFDTGGGIYPNMFDAHPPFQIDGNFGAVSGMAEMLLQSHETKPNEDGTELRILRILPALPKAWGTGKVRGLRARGGFEVSIEWQSGHLKQVELTSKSGGAAWLVYGNMSRKISMAPGQTIHWDGIHGI